MTTGEPRRAGPGPERKNRSVLFASIGAVLEWYDLMLYGYFAVVFSRIFFADQAGLIELIQVYATFAAGYLMRPLGGLFFGWMGERYGRRASLTASISLMSVPLIVTAVLPTYASWGIAATLVLILMRLIQGFSVGGEYSGTLVFLSEEAQRTRRGYLASFATMYSGIGVLLASGVALVMSAALTEPQLDSWGWRIAYGIGAVTAILGFFMRRSMGESTEFATLKEQGGLSRHPLRDAVRTSRRAILIVAALTGYLGIAYYIVATFLVGYLVSVVGITQTQSLVISTVVGAVYAVTAVYWGNLSDRLGRRRPMLWAAIALALLSYPAFLLLGSDQLALIYLGELVLLVPVLLFTGAFSAAVTELFPTAGRFAGVGIGYNFGNALLGATAPTIATALVHLTGIEVVPAYYLVAASLLIIPLIVTLPETAFDAMPTRHASPPTRRSSDAT